MKKSIDTVVVKETVPVAAEVGRPKEDLSSLPDDWYTQILLLYKEGAADVEVKALIYEWRGSFSNDLWDRWLIEEDEFSETIKMGKLISEAWWHSKGRKNLENKDFNFTGWYMNMKNRFGWKDRTDLTTNDEPFEQPVVRIIDERQRDTDTE